ncbi:glycosyltransferase [bacterium]|nr:glycosyltransferase [bacterium]
MIKIIVVNYNTQKYLKKFIDSLYLHTDANDFELIIVDSGSTEPASIDYIWSLSGSNIHRKFLSENIGYGGAIHAAYRDHIYPIDNYFVFANSDIEVVHAGWIDVMIAAAREHNAGTVGPKIILPSCRLGGAGFVGTPQNHKIRGCNVVDRGQFDTQQKVLFICGAFVLVSRQAYEEAGGFDAGYKLYFEETDLQCRMGRIGYAAIYEPGAVVLHHFNKSPNLQKRQEYLLSLRRFVDRWGCDDEWVDRQLLTEEEKEYFWQKSK